MLRPFATMICFMLVWGNVHAQPANFIDQNYAGNFSAAVGMTFDANGRMFVWERGGKVWIVENGVKSAQPLIDISDEVGNWRDFGLLGFALDPNFLSNGHIYLLYIVDRHHLLFAGTPNYNPNTNDYFKATIGRVTRYTAQASSNFTTVDNGSRTILLGETASTGFPSLHQSHGTGQLVFGTDGSLMVSLGDGASYSSVDEGSANETYYQQAIADGIIPASHNIGAYRVQLPGSLAGKLLRLDPETGDGVPSNPFYQGGNPRSPQSRTWALGLRNPCRMTLKPGTGSHNMADGDPGVFYIGDVGWGSREELNVCDAPGQNFGWPKHEGMTHQPNYNNPTYAPTSHELPKVDWRGGTARGYVNGSIVNVGSASLPGPSFTGNCSMGGVWYTGTDFPAEYQNTYFHADYGGDWIRNFGFDANHNPTVTRTFKTGADRVVYVATHPIEGGLYYLALSGNQVRKISYAPGNLPPNAMALSNITFGSGPLTVQFRGDLSGDPDGDNLSYLWNFGDGNTSTEANPSHTYNGNGSPQGYSVSLRVTDPSGLFDEKTLIVSVDNTPPVISSTSLDNINFFSHTNTTNLQLNAVVSDAEHSNAQLSYSWVTSLYHNDHNHDEPADNNLSTSTILSPVGCDGISYWYRISLTVTDPEGLSSTYVKDLQPDCSGANQSISFDPIPNKLVGDPDFSINTSSTSGLPVISYLVSGPASISGNTISLTGQPGIVTVRATQNGNSTFKPAVAIDRAFTVSFTPLPSPQSITFDPIPDKFNTDPAFDLSASASSGLPVSFEVLSGPATVSGNTVTLTGGLGTVIIRASQAGNQDYDPAPNVSQSFEVTEEPTPGDCVATGTFVMEKWNNVPGWFVSDIPLNTAPDEEIALNGPNFEIPSNNGEEYGVRIRAFICPPQTGNYTFWIASDDRGQLWLSTDDDSANKVLISEVDGYTGIGEWEKYPAQTSQAINLVEGNKYYVEVLMKEGQQGDHMAVGWQLPNGTLQRPMPASPLSPYQDGNGGPANQTISFDPIPNKFETAPPFNVSATASSGLPVSFSIVSGPATVSGNTVSLTGGLGTVTVQASQAGNENYNPAPPVTQSFEVTEEGTPGNCVATGSIVMEKWNNVPGWFVSDIPVNTPPDEQTTLTGPNFQIPSDNGEEYGVRLRGYLCAPATGAYTFWIASDDRGQLWLSTNDNPANKALIAEVDGWTGVGEWEKYPAQTSSAINLVLGQKYYIEVLMKEGQQGDHMAIGWQLPNGTLQRPMPIDPLSPYDEGTGGPLNQTITFNAISDKLNDDPPFAISATASSGLPVSFSLVSGPANVNGNTVSLTGSLGIVTIEANQAGNTNYNPAPSVQQSFEVIDPGQGGDCTAEGNILMDKWNNLPGWVVSDIPLNTTPDEQLNLNIFEVPVGLDDQYGARVRGYICAPQTGSYTFWIASDDNGQLWLSTDEDPANSSMIAEAQGWTNIYEWDKYPTQQSAPVTLIQGEQYYVEARLKEGFQGDHMAVGWQLPGGTLERPIPGTYLSPANGNEAIQARFAFPAYRSSMEYRYVVYPNPFTNTFKIDMTDFEVGEVSIEVRNLLGQIVFSKERVGSNEELNIGDEHPDGIYFLQISYNGNRLESIIHKKK